jgi:hypothetical protein
VLMITKHMKHLKSFPLSFNKSSWSISFSSEAQIYNWEMSCESSRPMARTWLSHQLDWARYTNHDFGWSSHGLHGITSQRADG